MIFFVENYILSLDGDLYFLLQNIGELLVKKHVIKNIARKEKRDS